MAQLTTFTHDSFVNIDVDLDHMEVSDFIVRLAQAIRSEQTSILEYVALRSANGITNEDRATIDKIIEEEKNHMVAFTSFLYKQVIMNHGENVDQANKEFELPKFGMEIFDNTVEGKLQESLQTTINKLCEKNNIETDEFYVGDLETGRIYFGLDRALEVVKDFISTSGQQVVIYNNTIASDEENAKIESTKVNEDTKISQKDKKYNVEVDVKYDSDIAEDILKNIEREAKIYTSNNNIELNDIKLQDGKFCFITNKEVNESDVENICKEIFNKASTLDKEIKIL